MKEVFEVKKTPTFDVGQTLDCGQVFRFKQIDGGYRICAGRHCADIIDLGTKYRFECDDAEFFKHYFDFDTDYQALQVECADGGMVSEAIEYGRGIHILRQEPKETIFSFIISKNNHIPRIKGIIDRICDALGDDIYGMGMQGKDLDTEGYWFYTLWTHGGAIIGPDGKSGFASPEAVAATRNYLRFIEAKATQPGVTGSSREDLQNLFAAGKLGIVLSGPWLNAQMAEQGKDIDYGISQIPISTASATYGVTDTISILETSKVKPQAMKFLEYIFSKENRLEFGKLEGFVPVLKSESTEPFFTGNPKMAIFLEMGPVAKFAPLFPRWEEMADGLKSELAKIYAGEATPEAGLQAAAEKMNALLAEK